MFPPRRKTISTHKEQGNKPKIPNKKRFWNRADKNTKPLRVGKDPEEGLLLTAKHFITERPIGYNDIITHYESFPGLQGYLNALRRSGVIIESDSDPEKFRFTPDGIKWAKDVFKNLRIKPEEWARASKHFSSKSGRPISPNRPTTLEPPSPEQAATTNIVQFPGSER